MASERNVLYLDFETTSLDPETCGLVQVAAVLVRYSADIEPLCQQDVNIMLDPGMPIEPEASQYHHVVDSDVAGWPKVDCGALEVLGQLAGLAHYVCGHQASRFDVPIARRLVGGTFESLPVIDTVRVARKMWPDLPEHKLGALAYRFELFDLADFELRRALHDASFDVVVCRALLERVLRETDMSVDELYDWQFVVDPATTFSFGKCKGMSIAEVCANDPVLVDWYLIQDWMPDRYPEEYMALMAIRKGRPVRDGEEVGGGSIDR